MIRSQGSCPLDHEASALPTRRAAVFDPPPAIKVRHESCGPLSRLLYPDGHRGWLITGYELARRVLSDSRFSARSELKRTPVARPGAEPFIGQPALPGWFVDMDRPDHARFRRLLGAAFSPRRMAELRPEIARIVDEQFESMVAGERPVDLVESFALPVPSRVICHLLGVPYAERDCFQQQSEILFSLEVSASEAETAMHELESCLRRTLVARRRRPGGDLVSHLSASGQLDENEIIGACVLLLTAGHETVASMIGLTTFLLLRRERAMARLRACPESLAATIEEALRYLTIFHLGVPRSPLVDVELEGQLLRRGETVTVLLPAANRDPERFEHPDDFDPGRDASGHLAFGFGPHQCIGRHLARLELESTIGALIARLPSLRLAVPACEVPIRSAGFYGVERLPITW